MRLVLHISTIVLGLALIGSSVSILRAVDGELRLQMVKPAEVRGKGTPRGVEMDQPMIRTEAARRFTLLGSIVGVLGAAATMIGIVLTVAHLMQTRGKRSRLGTDFR